MARKCLFSSSLQPSYCIRHQGLVSLYKPKAHCLSGTHSNNNPPLPLLAVPLISTPKMSSSPFPQVPCFFVRQCFFFFFVHLFKTQPCADFTANFSSPGVTLSCGPSPPGWFAFEHLYMIGRPQCFSGNITVLTPGGPTPFGPGRIFIEVVNGTTINVKTAVLGNNNDHDCSFGDQETLKCSGAGPTFFQPLAGTFTIIRSDKNWLPKLLA